jgi:hypothetical protein
MCPAHGRSIPSARRLATVALLAAGACRGAAGGGAVEPPPLAEFVLSAGDSAFWVSTAGGAIHVRGAPIELARIEGRFYELYVTDDDRSFEDATFVGQRVYRRDLVRGDSTLVFQDTLVPRLAREYARRNPDDVPLARDDEPSDRPLWDAQSTLDLTEIQGPFVSYDLRIDVRGEAIPPWQESRRGVIDLRTGGRASLATLLGGGVTAADVEHRREALLHATIDSLGHLGGHAGVPLGAALAAAAADRTNFVLTTLAGGPALAWSLAADGVPVLALPPVGIGEPSWWGAVAPTLPMESADGARAVWRHEGYEVVVRYDSAAGGARLALRDSTSREWAIARIPRPATRIFWLDRPPLDSAARRALARAFDESSLYDESVRAVTDHRRRRAALARVAADRIRRPSPFRWRSTVPHA